MKKTDVATDDSSNRNLYQSFESNFLQILSGAMNVLILQYVFFKSFQFSDKKVNLVGTMGIQK